jgi:excisionase family DNA binding protein
VPEEILTIREVAEFLKVTERTIYRLVAEGKIPSFKVGGSWRFQRVDLVQWMNEQASGQAGHARHPKGDED